MTFSLNQIEQTARKAARGCNLPWGLADEVGKAMRWLHAFELDGVSLLVDLLDRHDYRDPARLAPRTLAGVWQARGGILDPLLVGVSLSDCVPGMREIQTRTIAYPLLAAGFIGNTAQMEDRAFTLNWGEGSLSCRRDGLRIIGETPALETPSAPSMTCRPGCCDGTHRPPKIGEGEIDAVVWSRLERFAHRTYVAASDASRLAGAGAGLEDND